MLCHFFAELGLTEPRLEINSLGCPECRQIYRQVLKDFLHSKLEFLCEDCKRRYETNPLRSLDCKSTGCKEATAGAPSVLDYIDAACADHFAMTRHYLDTAGTAYSINPRMVRGLDYYTRTTFELVTALLGAQSAVAAGPAHKASVERHAPGCSATRTNFRTRPYTWRQKRSRNSRPKKYKKFQRAPLQPGTQRRESLPAQSTRGRRKSLFGSEAVQCPPDSFIQPVHSVQPRVFHADGLSLGDDYLAAVIPYRSLVDGSGPAQQILLCAQHYASHLRQTAGPKGDNRQK